MNDAAIVVYVIATTIVMSDAEKNWNVVLHDINPGSTVVSGQYSVPLHQSETGTMVGTLQASRAMLGPAGGLPSVGGSLHYTHHSTGLSASVNANPSLNSLQGGLSASGNVLLFKDTHGHLQANVHGARMFGGPRDSDSQTYGTGITYGHNSGVYAGVDVTRGARGNTYSASTGFGHQLGPGRFILSAGAFMRPDSDKVDGQVWTRFVMPLPRFLGGN